MIHRLSMEDENIIKEVLTLQQEAYRVEAELIDFMDLPPLRDDRESLKASHEAFYGFYVEEELAGIISFEIEENILDICRVAVKPTFFRRGIAEKMLSYIIEIHPRIHKLLVSTGSNNFPAVRFYKKHGFSKYEEQEIREGLVISKFEKTIN